jgi:small-conductance mechanosensitive channel
MVSTPTTSSTLAVASLHDVDVWARTNLLQALLLITGTALFTRFATWLSARVTERIDSGAKASDSVVRAEDAKYRHAAIQVVTWALLALVYCLVTVLVFQRLGFPLSSFVAPASVIGVALGFGAQRIVQDLLSGFLIVTERQYGYGDLVRLAVAGTPEPATGTVEEVTLRTTRIRSSNGEVVTTPNGQIIQVTNLSKDWARAVVDVPIPTTADLSRVTDILRAACEDIANGELGPLLLDTPSVMGVESLDVGHVSVRVVARTRPGKQFEVARRLRERLTLALLGAGVLGAEHRSAVEPRQDS